MPFLSFILDSFVAVKSFVVNHIWTSIIIGIIAFFFLLPLILKAIELTLIIVFVLVLLGFGCNFFEKKR